MKDKRLMMNLPLVDDDKPRLQASPPEADGSGPSQLPILHGSVMVSRIGAARRVMPCRKGRR